MTWLVLAALATFTAVRAANNEQLPAANDRVSTFYYLWYGNPEEDGGQYSHWGHSVLPHWTEHVRKQYPEARFVPPHDIHAPFYPQKGLYSSRNRTVIRQHLQEMHSAGIGVAVLSWWGREGFSTGDSQGVVNEAAIEAVFQVADELLDTAGVRIALHLEPYPGRDITAFRADIEFLVGKYGSYRSWQRIDGRRVYYVYDSYHIWPEDWAALLVRDSSDPRAGQLSLRSSSDSHADLELDLDGFFIGLWLDRRHGQDLKRGGFDGAYTYFAADGFSYGSSTANWRAMAAEAESGGMLFIPCVGPGYDDSKIRPWNAHTRKERGVAGQYYRSMWERALASGATRVGVTSFNEWGEGTQIEPAVPRSIDVDALAPLGLALERDTRRKLGLKDSYDDYGPAAGDEALYLRITREFADRLNSNSASAKIEAPVGTRGKREEL